MDGMASEAYELLALLMRYVFVGIGALILWRAYRWLRRDARQYKKAMRSLPDAGLVGEMVNLKTGESQPLPREGLIGSSGACDIRVREPGVARRHALFAFEEGKGLRVTPHLGNRVLMEGVELKGAAHALHGTQLQLGDAVLRVRLFAGLKVPHPMQFQQDIPSGPDMTGVETPENEDVPSPFAAVPQFAPDEEEPAQEDPSAYYQGNYTEDGQMTWDYVYSLEELEQARQRQINGEESGRDAENDEALPYESPVPRRRRRWRQ